MRLEQLLYFVEAVERSSIMAASEELHVTHQNVSKSIKQLENELSVCLLKRTREGVSLTPTGKPIYEYAKEILHNIDQIRLTAQSFSFNRSTHQDVSGAINIIASPTFSAILAPAIQEINLYYPNLFIWYNTLEPAHINHLLAQKEHTADIYFTTVDESSVLAQELEERGKVYLLKKDMLKLLVKRTSPLRDYKAISLKKLSEVPLALYNTNPAIVPLYLQLLKKHNFKPKKIYQSNSAEIIQNYLYSGVIASIATPLTTTRPTNMPDRQCILVPLNVKLPVEHLMFFPEANQQTKIFTIFMSVLQNTCSTIQRFVANDFLNE